MLKYILFSFLACTLNAQENIAVMELDPDGVTPSEAKTLTNKLRGELLATGKFTVIERGQMDEVLKEQGFQQTGCTSQECVVQVGQLLGVKSIVAGSIGKVGKIYVISLRLIDVAKGNILKNPDEETEGDLADVLRVGIHNVARKMADLEPDRAVVAPPAPAVAAPLPPPAASPPPAPVSFRESRIQGVPARRQEAMEKRAAARADFKARNRGGLSIAGGRSSLDSKSFNWALKGRFNVSMDGLEWDAGPHWGIDVEPLHFYSNPDGNSFVVINGLGLTFDRNTSVTSDVDVTDSLTGATGSVTLPEGAFKLTRFGLTDNLLFGWRFKAGALSFEPFIGIGGGFDFDFCSGNVADTLTLSTMCLRASFPLGLRLAGKRFFTGFERVVYFGTAQLDDNLSYDDATGDAITGGFSFESAAYWAIRLGFLF